MITVILSKKVGFEKFVVRSKKFRNFHVACFYAAMAVNESCWNMTAEIFRDDKLLFTIRPVRRVCVDFINIMIDPYDPYEKPFPYTMVTMLLYMHLVIRILVGFLVPIAGVLGLIQFLIYNG